MIKKLSNTVEVYGNDARYYDYLNRILASFAEIYNYDYSASALLEEGSLFKEENACIRKNGIMGRIRAFYENHLNENVVPSKFFYNEVMFREHQNQEYGYLTLGKLDEAMMADMIAMSVRILEACRLKDVKVFLDINDSVKENLVNTLEYLDISYEEKKLDSDCKNVAFEIRTKNLLNQEVVLITGKDYSSPSLEIDENLDKVFGFTGSLELLVSLTRDKIKLDEKMLDVVLTYNTKEECNYAYYLGQELRLNGFKTEIIKRCEKSFIKKYFNTKYVISTNQEDIKNGELLLVDLYTNDRKKVQENDLIQHLDMNF